MSRQRLARQKASRRRAVWSAAQASATPVQALTFSDGTPLQFSDSSYLEFSS
jgi:hypothetical protein